MKKISERKRIVVKVGTSTLTHKTGMLNIRRVGQLVKIGRASCRERVFILV